MTCGILAALAKVGFTTTPGTLFCLVLSQLAPYLLLNEPWRPAASLPRAPAGGLVPDHVHADVHQRGLRMAAVAALVQALHSVQFAELHGLPAPERPVPTVSTAGVC